MKISYKSKYCNEMKKNSLKLYQNKNMFISDAIKTQNSSNINFYISKHKTII